MPESSGRKDKVMGEADEKTSKEIQAEIEFNELIETAKLRAQAKIDEEVEEENKKTPWYKKMFGWAKTLFVSVVKVVFFGVKETVIFIINNEKNQTLAKLAVLTAIEAGLKGKDAWKVAYDILSHGDIYISEHVKVNASEIDTNIKETLLQLVYTCIKNKLKV